MRCNAGVQYRWGGVVVAWIRLATTRTGLWKKCLGYPRHPVVSLPPVHAADSLGHSPNGNHGSCAFLCCTTHQKHLARHHWPQFRQPALLPKLDQWRQVPVISFDLSGAQLLLSRFGGFGTPHQEFPDFANLPLRAPETRLSFQPRRQRRPPAGRKPAC